jgi:hypothetical protein
MVRVFHYTRYLVSFIPPFSPSGQGLTIGSQVLAGVSNVVFRVRISFPLLFFAFSHFPALQDIVMIGALTGMETCDFFYHLLS